MPEEEGEEPDVTEDDVTEDDKTEESVTVSFDVELTIGDDVAVGEGEEWEDVDDDLAVLDVGDDNPTEAVEDLGEEGLLVNNVESETEEVLIAVTSSDVAMLNASVVESSTDD